MTYYADMPKAAVHSLLLALSLTLLAEGAVATAEETDPDAEIAALQLERNRLEREIAQYKASISLLRANGADFDSQSMRTLAGEVDALRDQLATVTAREQALTDAGDTSKVIPENDDAARMASLLRQHYARQEIVESSPLEEGPDTDALLEQVAIDRGKIRLSGSEGITALSLISERLANTPSNVAQRDVDEVLHVEIRQAGRLVSSSTHGLRALGRSQYIGRLSLPTGDVQMRVRSERWQVDLNGGSTVDYLVTLYAPGSGQPQLHLIPVEELKATRWSDIPSWVPDLGAADPATS